MTLRPLLALALAAAAAGCVETTTETTTLRTGSAADESACLAAVGRQTGNAVAVLSSSFSEANTEVIVGVGPDRAPWRCLVNRGVVAEVMSLTNEGTL